MNKTISDLRGFLRRHWAVIILTFIFLLALWIRLYRSHEYFPFWQEQVDDLLHVRAIWSEVTSGHFTVLPLNGQMGTYQWSQIPRGAADPVYHGVFYYYLLLPAAILSNFDPYGVVLFLIGVGVTEILLLYYAGVLLFRNKTIGLLVAFLGASSFWLAVYSRWIWTPSLEPFFALLSLVSFLCVMDGRKTWWYALAFSLAAGSQIHDSGYVPLIVYIVFLLWFRPGLPKGWGRRLLVAVLFLFPILPTALYEVSSGFRMTGALIHVSAGALLAVRSLPVSFLRSMADSVGLTMTGTVSVPWYQHTILSGISRYSWALWVLFYGVIAVWLYTYKPKTRVNKVLLVVWWIVMIPIPMVVEFLYKDETITDYSRMNNLLFFFPFVLLTLGGIADYVWQSKYWVLRLLVCFFIGGYVYVNGVLIHEFLWSYNENSWAYQELQTVSRLIPAIASGKPYNLVIYRYSEGSFINGSVYEPLYLIQLAHASMPEAFNGLTHWGSTGEPLRGGKPDMTIVVIDRTYLAHASIPDPAVFVGETRSYQVYRIP